MPYLVLLLLAVMAVVVIWRAGPFAEQVRIAVAQELSRQLGREVSIGKASLTVSGRLVLRDVEVRQSDGAVLLSVPEAIALVGRRGSRFGLLSKPTELREITLVRPRLQLVRAADGALNISDLIDRQHEAPARFEGKVTIRDGSLELVDEARGGVITTLRDADGEVRYPVPGTAVFRLRAGGGEGEFEELKIEGSWGADDPKRRVRASVSHLDLAYALARLPETSALSFSAGVADVTAEIAPGEEAAAGAVAYSLEAEVEGASVTFPWLRQPLEGVGGKLRFAGGDLHLDEVSGTVVGAPIRARGVISGLPHAQLGLEVQVSDIRYKQLRALFPGLSTPAGLVLSGPMEVAARVEGPASDVVVSGDASVRVIKFRAIPWHDLAARFRYQGGRLKIEGLRAHGSPRRVEADLEVGLRGPQPEAEGTLELIEMPVSLLAQMAGLDDADLEGTASISASGRFDGGLTFAGKVTITDLSWRGLPLGRLSGDLAVSEGTIEITGGSIEGATATGKFAGKVLLRDRFELVLDLSSLNLTAIGRALQVDTVTGLFPAAVRLSGGLAEGGASADFTLGPGEAFSRAFDEITGGLEVTPWRMLVRDLKIRSGDSRYVGGLAVSGWREAPESTALTGRLAFEEVRLADWLPAATAALPDIGVLDGTLTLDGTLAEPRAKLEASLTVPNSNGASYQLGQAALRYEDRRVIVDELVLDDGRSHLSVVGEYRPETSVSLDLVGDPLDLASLTPWLKQRYGLALTGPMRLKATARGAPDNPRVEFGASAAGLMLNEAPLEAFHLSGSVTDGLLRIASSEVRYAGGALSLAGGWELASGALDLTLNLEEIDLAKTLLLYDTAIYRLFHSGVPVTHLSSYLVIPARIRPLGGTLTAEAHVTGSPSEPRVEGELGLRGLSFAGRSVNRIEGKYQVSLEAGAGGKLSLREGGLSLEASHETALASLKGQVSTDGDLFLTADVSNLDLGLLGPWLWRGGEAPDLPPGLSIGGQAAINFDVTGTIAQPVLRGDVFVDDLSVGELRLEAADASPISLARGLLRIEQMRMRNGPMEGRGQASFPVLAVRQEAGEPPIEPSAELHIRNAEFAPVPGMTPVAFDADFYLQGNRLLIGRGQVGEEGGEGAAGLRGKMGRGAIRAGGEVELRNLSLARLAENQYDVTCELDDVEVHVPDLVSAQLRGRLLLSNAPDTGEPLLATPEGDPLVLFDAVFGVPERLPRVTGGLVLPFAPALAVDVLVGENVWFRHGAKGRPTEIEIEPGVIVSPEERRGYLHLGGVLSAAGLTLDGHAAARRGQLAFPNAVLKLRSGEIRLDRTAGEFRVTVAGANADGRVGNYYVSLRPTGRVYPPADEAELALGIQPYRLNAVSVPSLEEGFVLVLLMGPVAAPTRGGGSDMTAMFSPPGSPSQSTAQITGIMLAPIGGSAGLPEVGIDYSFQGQLRLRLGEELFRKFFVSYVSSLGGPSETDTLRFTYEVTPLWSLGWGVNELERSRWEVQAFVPF